MSKYIDAEQAIKEIGVPYNRSIDHDDFVDGFNGGLESAANTIKDMPAADVQEVRHGRWLEHQEDRWIYARCSVCNSVHNTKTNYCPNCGSRMDMEEVGE